MVVVGPGIVAPVAVAAAGLAVLVVVVADDHAASHLGPVGRSHFAVTEYQHFLKKLHFYQSPF